MPPSQKRSKQKNAIMRWNAVKLYIYKQTVIKTQENKNQFQKTILNVIVKVENGVRLKLQMLERRRSRNEKRE